MYNIVISVSMPRLTESDQVWAIGKLDTRMCVRAAAGAHFHGVHESIVSDVTVLGRTEQRYQNAVLQLVLVPFVQQHPTLQLFQQDNAYPPHCQSSASFSGSGAHPATKDAWNLLGGHVHQRQPQSMTTAQLQYALIQDWRAILQQQSQTLVQTMCRRVNASITPREA